MDTNPVAQTIKTQILTILGLLLMVGVGFIAFKYFANSKTENQDALPPIEVQVSPEEPQKHIVEKGESLWTISEKYYENGYNWVEIKNENMLSDADNIEAGQELIIPNLSSEVVQANESPSEEEAQISVSPQTKSDIEELFGKKEPEKESEPETSKYTVSANDSLWKIAEKELGDGNKWIELAKKNNIKNPGIIRAGQELLVVRAQEKGQITAEAASTSVETDKQEGADSGNEKSELKMYTVEKGDSLWEIAKGAFGDGNRWVDIAKENQLVNPSIIHAGNVFRIPS